jgi:3alpha(or 20beta)-hydroxysteroid dehydrogenase
MSRGGRVAGRVAIVTGGSRGIGRATTQLLAGEGARVLIADVLDEPGQALARDLSATNAAYVHLDVGSRQQWEAAIDACQDLFGPPTILVNNAGVMVAASIEESTEDQFHRVFEVNMLGPFLGTRAVTPVMRKAGGGSIIILSSAGERQLHQARGTRTGRGQRPRQRGGARADRHRHEQGGRATRTPR